MQTVALTKLRELDLLAPPQPGRPSHLSAASGLACIQSFIYVVADDELHLGVFRKGSNEPGRLVRLFDGDLPDSKRDRKKQKPDLEALVLLPADRDHPHGSLLALGSGSRPNRRMGALVGLDAEGAVRGPPRTVDLASLLVPLDAVFPALNIEGAVVSGDGLLLFQRGNARHPGNAVMRYPLAALRDVLRSGPAKVIEPLSITRFDLGRIDGIPLTVTDAAALPDGRVVITAVAEDTDDNYSDGPCAGAAIGMIDNDGRLLWMRPVDRPAKIEGVDVHLDGNVIKLLLVTDADDPDIPAGLFSTSIDLGC